jgi:hypothetical protein
MKMKVPLITGTMIAALAAASLAEANTDSTDRGRSGASTQPASSSVTLRPDSASEATPHAKSNSAHVGETIRVAGDNQWIK